MNFDPGRFEGCLQARKAGFCGIEYAVQLFNMDDGRGVDWPMVATTAFRVAMSCLNEVPGDPQAEKVLRRIEGEVYDRLPHWPHFASSQHPGISERRRAARLRTLA